MANNELRIMNGEKYQILNVYCDKYKSSILDL